MSALSKTEQVLQECENFRLDILAVAEARWKGCGEKKLKTVNSNMTYTVLYSGKTDRHAAGVAAILNPNAAKSLCSWKPINERILYTRFASKHAKLSLVICYAPTNDADETSKDGFYETLQSVLDSIPLHDVACLAGDLNAKVGQDRSYCPEVLGHHGLGTINENGARLVSFAMSNDLLIGGTLFEHKDIHKYTWTSPDKTVKNQIDHFLIRRRWRTSLKDVRSYRSADVGSDHELLVATLKLKLRSNRSRQPTKLPSNFDVEKLRDKNVRRQFNIKLSNRFEALADIPQDVEEAWTTIQQNYAETAEEVLGFKKSIKEQWISQKTWDLIEDRKKIKQSTLSNDPSADVMKDIAYKEADREVKKSARSDKRQHLNEKARMAEEAARRGDTRAVYRLTKEIVGKTNVQDGPVKEENGRLLTDPDDRKNRWADYFENLLNRPSPSVPPDIPDSPFLDLLINENEPTADEILSASKKLKNGKSPGSDRISGEMVKSSIRRSLSVWLVFFSLLWQKEKVPKDWRAGTIIKLFKKGDATVCGNYRGINLLSIPGKLFCIIILTRLQAALDPHLREEQHGFRPKRSCADLIFTLRSMLEESNEWRQRLYILFVDFEKAFDSLDHPIL